MHKDGTSSETAQERGGAKAEEEGREERTQRDYSPPWHTKTKREKQRSATWRRDVGAMERLRKGSEGESTGGSQVQGKTRQEEKRDKPARRRAQARKEKPRGEGK